MNDDKLNNEFDNFFRKEMENLPEEKPTAQDWELMSKRIHSDGLLLGNGSTNGKKYYLFILLFVLLAGLVSLPFIMTDKNRNVKKEEAQHAEDTNKNALSASVQTSTVTAPKETTNNNSGSQLHNNSLEPLHVKKNFSSEEKLYSAEEKALAWENNKGLNPSSGNTSGSSIDANDNIKENTVGSNAQNITSDETAASAEEKNNSTVSASADTVPALLEKIPADSALGTTLTNDNTNKSDSLALKRFRLGIYVSLDYNYYTLKENKDVAQAESDFVNQSSSIKGEKWGGQYTVGIIGGYLFTQKLSLEAGVFYSQKKKLHADIYTPAYTNAEEEMFTDFTYDYEARYFEMYGRIKYYFHQRKNSFYATLGAAGSFNLHSGNETSDYFSRVSHSESSNVTDRVTLDASSAGLVLVLSAGMEIPVSNRLDLYIEPAYRYSFNPVIKQPDYNRVPVEHFLRSISLATGLMYRF
jgi:hypothetical protein